MKIGLYNSSIENSAVGSVSAAILAVALAVKHQTEIVCTPGSSTREQVALLCGGSPELVSFRTVEPPPQIITDPGSPDRRYEALRNWGDKLTSAYDLFINFSDRLPIYCSAARGVLIIQFPHDFIPSPYRELWVDHLNSYQLKLANSYYTQFWTRVFWEIDCPVLYPPVPKPPSSDVKENLIVSAGSFNATRPHKLLELVSAFQQLRMKLPDWSLSIIGNLDVNVASRKQFESVRDAANESGISVLANPSFETESKLFSRARIFWQAAGLGDDPDLEPGKVEPFNLNVLRAMAARCVPLVMNRGGLSEVVRQGENGFFWTNIDELINYTLALAHDERQHRGFARAAQCRAHDFRPESYSDNFLLQSQAAFGIKHRPRANPLWLWKRLVNSAGQYRTRR